MKRAAWLGAAVLVAGPLAVAVGAATAAAPSAKPIGGFTIAAQAAPISVLLYEPVLPVPSSPQGELHLSYTATTVSTSRTDSASTGAVCGPTELR